MNEMNLIGQRSNLGNVGHNSLAHLFHNMRIYRSLSQKDLAEKFGVSEDFVLEVEEGLRRPPLQYWLQCAEVFGANPNWVRVKWINERSIYAKRRLEEKIFGGSR